MGSPEEPKGQRVKRPVEKGVSCCLRHTLGGSRVDVDSTFHVPRSGFWLPRSGSQNNNYPPKIRFSMIFQRKCKRRPESEGPRRELHNAYLKIENRRFSSQVWPKSGFAPDSGFSNPSKKQGPGEKMNYFQSIPSFMTSPVPGSITIRTGASNYVESFDFQPKWMYGVPKYEIVMLESLELTVFR